MSYCVKLGEWGSVFVVPSSVVDKHIKLVGSTQLKVLLWILRNSGSEFSEEDIASSLSMNKEDVKDALAYWIETGMLKSNGKEITPGEKDIKQSEEHIKSSSEADIIPIAKGKLRSTSRMLKPDSAYVIERVKSSEEVEFLMKEAQVILGRPISTGDSAILITLMDNEGLPIDVILMIMQYAVSVGKGNMRYIEAVGISWAAEDIDTIEKAEEKIKFLSETNLAWRSFEKIIGTQRQPTSREKEAINRWYNLWHYSEDMVKEAYEICIDSNGKYVLKYMDSIISRWNKEGISDLKQARLDKKKTKSKTMPKDRNPSYNIEEYERYNIYDEINLELKGKNEV